MGLLTFSWVCPFSDGVFPESPRGAQAVSRERPEPPGATRSTVGVLEVRARPLASQRSDLLPEGQVDRRSCACPFAASSFGSCLGSPKRDLRGRLTLVGVTRAIARLVTVTVASKADPALRVAAVSWTDHPEEETLVGCKYLGTVVLLSALLSAPSPAWAGVPPEHGPKDFDAFVAEIAATLRTGDPNRLSALAYDPAVYAWVHANGAFESASASSAYQSHFSDYAEKVRDRLGETVSALQAAAAEHGFDLATAEVEAYEYWRYERSEFAPGFYGRVPVRVVLPSAEGKNIHLRFGEKVCELDVEDAFEFPWGWRFGGRIRVSSCETRPPVAGLDLAACRAYWEHRMRSEPSWSEMCRDQASSGVVTPCLDGLARGCMVQREERARAFYGCTPAVERRSQTAEEAGRYILDTCQCASADAADSLVPSYAQWTSAQARPNAATRPAYESWVKSLREALIFGMPVRFREEGLTASSFSGLEVTETSADAGGSMRVFGRLPLVDGEGGLVLRFVLSRPGGLYLVAEPQLTRGGGQQQNLGARIQEACTHMFSLILSDQPADQRSQYTSNREMFVTECTKTFQRAEPATAESAAACLLAIEAFDGEAFSACFAPLSR